MCLFKHPVWVMVAFGCCYLIHLSDLTTAYGPISTQMSLGRVLAQQEAAVVDSQIGHLSDCKFLSEQEVVELAAKCKVSQHSTHLHLPMLLPVKCLLVQP